MSFEERAVALHKHQRSMPVKYRMADNAFIDWFIAGANEATKWTNVKDELPTSEDYYLAFSEENGIEVVFYNVDGRCWKLTSNGYVITHWQELPNAPEIEKK